MAYYLARLFTRYVSNQSTCERTAEQLPHDSRVVAVPQRVQLIYTYIRNTFRWCYIDSDSDLFLQSRIALAQVWRDRFRRVSSRVRKTQVYKSTFRSRTLVVPFSRRLFLVLPVAGSSSEKLEIKPADTYTRSAAIALGS